MRYTMGTHNRGERDREPQAEPELTLHVFTVSAGLVGVCLTGIGLLRLFSNTVQTATITDDILAIDAALFAGTCFLAFFAIRARQQSRRYVLRQAADAIFLFALTLMVAVCLLIVYAVV